MTAEEIGFEPPTRGRRGYAGLFVAVVVAAAVVWILVTGSGDDSATPRPSPTAPGPSVAPTSGESPPAGRPGAGFQLGEVCSPRTTSGTLTVRFTLANRSTADLDVLGVVPSLPLGGLTPRGTSLYLGGCADEDGPARRSLTVPAETSALVVFTFALPKTCPQALPVFADVTSRNPGESGLGELEAIPVYSDLGDVDFATCP